MERMLSSDIAPTGKLIQSLEVKSDYGINTGSARPSSPVYSGNLFTIEDGDSTQGAARITCRSFPHPSYLRSHG